MQHWRSFIFTFFGDNLFLIDFKPYFPTQASNVFRKESSNTENDNQCSHLIKKIKSENKSSSDFEYQYNAGYFEGENSLIIP